MNDLRGFIAGMPKCELHVHIEGTLEPEMKFELARRNGMSLPYKDAAEMRAAYDFHDLPSFLKIYYEGMRVLVHEPDFYDLTFAYLAKAHSQNVRYVEMFFDPQPHTGRGVPFDVVIRGIRRAQLEAERILGIKSQLIMCFLRDWSAEFAMTTLVQSLPYREWIIGVGLDSDEKNNPPVKFKAVFERARLVKVIFYDALRRRSAELDRTYPANVWKRSASTASITVSTSWIARNFATRSRAANWRSTVCPVSNAYVTNGSKAKEIRRMLELGIRAMVHSDDPAYFRGYINENFVCTQEEAELGAEGTGATHAQCLRKHLAARGAAKNRYPGGA